MSGCGWTACRSTSSTAPPATWWCASPWCPVSRPPSSGWPNPERLYRFLIDHAPDVVAWQLVDTTFLWVSPAVQTILGYSPEDLVGRTAYAFMHPDDESTARATEWFDPAAAAPAPMLVRMRHSDGRYRSMEVAGQLVRDADGAPAQLRTSWRDVTARVKAEQDRDAAVQLVQSVVANSPIGIAVSDGTGVLEQVNEALCSMLGCASDQLLGHRVDEFVHPDDTCPDGSAQLLSGALTAHESECRYLRPDGTAMWGTAPRWCCAATPMTAPAC